MFKVPNLYTPEAIIKWDTDAEIKGVTGSRWVPARAEPYRAIGLWRRTSLAWKVFTGQADVLEWTETDPIKRQKLRKK